MRYFLGTLALVAVLSPQSRADVMTQPAVWSGAGTSVGSTWTSQSDAGVNGYRTADDFTLTSAAVITRATWLGFYYDSVNNLPGSPNTSSWVIRFSADNSGIPGSTLQSTTLTPAQVNSSILGSGLFNGLPMTIYQFTAPLPAFDAAADVTYWFSPLSRATDFSPLFGWIQGTGGNGTSFQTQFANGSVTNTFVRDGDRAFSLSAVPEPGTTCLVGLGLAVSGALLARRRIPRPISD